MSLFLRNKDEEVVKRTEGRKEGRVKTLLKKCVKGDQSKTKNVREGDSQRKENFER